MVFIQKVVVEMAAFALTGSVFFLFIHFLDSDVTDVRSIL